MAPAGSGAATFIEEHPTGIGTVIASALVAALQDQGVTSFTPETAVLVVGAVAAIISLFTPRWRRN